MLGVSKNSTSQILLAECGHVSTLMLQVEGLRNEYNRVTSGANPKASSSTGQSGSDDVSQLRQQAQQLQARAFCHSAHTLKVPSAHCY